MRLLGRLKQVILENPLAGRQLITGFTGPRLGAAFTLVALAFSITDLTIFLVVFIDHQTLGISFTAGEHLHLFNNIVLYALMTILLPLRVSGLIDGPRFGRCLDQLVVTGESPLRLHIGSWIQGLYYLFLLMAVSLPFQGLAFLFGGVSLGGIAAAYGVLALYANVIIAMTLGLAVMTFEFMAVAAAIIAFLIFGLCSFTPLPPEIAEITPVRWLLSSRISDDFLELPPGMVALYNREPVFFVTALPAPVYRAILWGLLFITPLGFILLGPLHRFQPGLDAFGAVVLPGDRKRSLLRKVRLALTRRVEVAFLYENRPRWCAGWDFALRALPGILWLVLAWGVCIGLVYEGSFTLPNFNFFDDWRLAVSFSLTSSAVFAWMLFHGDTRERIRWRERVGPLAVPRGILWTAILALILSGLLGVHYWVLGQALEDQAVTGNLAAAAGAGPAPVNPAAGSSQPTIDDYLGHWRRVVPAVIIFLANAHLLGRLLGRFIANHHIWRIALIALTASALFIPVGLLDVLREAFLPRQGTAVLMISPITLCIPEHFLPWPAADRFAHYLAWQGGFALVVSGLLALFWIAPLLRRAGKPVAAARAAAAFVAAVISLAGAGALSAQEPGALEILEVIRGFNGGSFDQGVDFYTATIRNRSARDFGGVYYIQSGREWTTTRRRFELPRGTTKVLRWNEIRLDNPYYNWRLQSRGALLVFETGAGEVSVSLPGISVLQGRTSSNPLQRQFILVQEHEGPIAQGLSGSEISWLRSAPLALPEDSRAYTNASAVLIGPTDLSRWTEGQRRALYDWVRLGGAAIFYGGIDPASLDGTGVWGEILRPRSSRRVEAGGRELNIEELEEAETTFWLEGAEGGEPVPLISARSIGPGCVAHLSFDPGFFQPPGSRSGSAGFWTEFLDRLPQSSHPVTLLTFGAEEQLRDASSLYGLIAYFALYTLLLGPGLFFGFRRRSLRRWIPLYIVLLSGTFLAAIPLLNALLHSHPSFAELHAIDYFGEGDRRGVRLALIRAQSSGRQRHRLEVEGVNLQAVGLDRRWGSYFYGPYAEPGLRMVQANLPLGELESGVRELDLDLLPWSERKVLLLSDVQRPQAWGGSAVFDRRAGALKFEVDGVPPGDKSFASLLYYNIPDPGNFDSVPLESGGSLRGIIHGTAQVTQGRRRGGSSPPWIWRAQQNVATHMGLHLAPSSKPRVILAIGIPASGDDLGIESADLAFECEWQERLADQRRRQGLVPLVYQRGGKTWRSYRYHAILQEIPLEIR